MQSSREIAHPIAKAFESCLKPIKDRPGYFVSYRCPAGVWTLGWGTTSSDGEPITEGLVWSRQKCDAKFLASAPKYERHIDKQLQGVTVTQAQYDALWDWSYNTGGPADSSVWTYARQGDVDGTCERLMRWNKARVNGQMKELAGLTRRRKSECALYRGDIEGALKIAGAHRETGEEMVQKVERPTPPLTEVAKRAPGAIATTTAGTGTAAGSPQAHTDYSAIIMVAGIIIAAIGVVLLVRAFMRVSADWS